MKEMKLIERVVLEIKDNQVEEATNEYVAKTLRSIADAIESGKTGDIFMPDMGIEVSWEYESKRYGGFRILSDKSLLSQYYYGSEKKPHILDDGLYEDVKQFNIDYENNEEKIGENIFTKTDFLTDAVQLLSRIETEVTL